MAVTGYKDFSCKYGRGAIRVNYSETVNESARTSTVTVTSVQVKAYNWTDTYYCIGSVSLGGTSIRLDGNYSVYVTNTGSWFTINHPNNGSLITKTVSNDGSGGTINVALGPVDNNNDFNAYTGSGGGRPIEISPKTESITLSTFQTDVASTVSATGSVTLGDNAIITITAVKSSYTHTIQYSFNNSSWVNIASGKAGGSFSWNTSAVASYFSSSTTRTCYIRCLTYSSGAQIGSASSTSITITAAGAPSISSISVTPANDNPTILSWNNGDIFVQGYTKAEISVEYSLPAGTNLSSCRISMNGNVISEGASDSFITNSAITEAGSVNVSVTIVDSRGGSATANTSINVYPYSRPYATQAGAIRYSDNPDVEDKEKGTNISAKATMSYSSINGYNTAQIAVRYKPAGGVYPSTYTRLSSGAENYVKINSEEISTEQSYTVQFLITDSLHTLDSDPTTIEITIPTSTVVLHAKDGGDGLAIGGYSSEDGFEVWWDTFLHSRLILAPETYGPDEPNITNARVGQVYFQLIE